MEEIEGFANTFADSIIKFTQINLQHCKEAAAVLCSRLCSLHTGVALVQEPWVFKGRVRGLNFPGGSICYHLDSPRPRACIAVTRAISFTPLPHLTTSDTTVGRINITIAGESRSIVVASVYLPYDSPSLPPSQEMVGIVEYCRQHSLPFILGCDANSHHICWGSSDINQRGRALLEYLTAMDLQVYNQGNEPTFQIVNRKEVIDLTIGSQNLPVNSWLVSPDPSLSDHRQIHFNVDGGDSVPVVYRNPRRTDWELFQKTLSDKAGGRIVRIMSTHDVETEVASIEEDMQQSYKIACPEKIWKPGKNAQWWNPELSRLRVQVRALWRRYRAFPDNANHWEDYKETRNSFKKAIREAKRDSWRRFCAGVEGPSAASRLYRLLGKDPTSHVSEIRPPGEVDPSERSVLEHLMNTHFPGSQLLARNDFPVRPNQYPTEYDLQQAKTVITEDRVTWAINSFAPYKASGIDGIFPALLQRGLQTLLPLITGIFQVCLATGYIPERWRIARVIFLPKPGKPSYKEAKAFRPISLTSFLLKSLERLVDRFIRDGVLHHTPLHHSQHAYQAGLSTETALHDIVLRIERTLSRRQYAMGCFLDIQGAFDNVPVESIEKALIDRHVCSTVTRWLVSMLRQRRATSTVGCNTATVALNRGCPQGGVVSPLCWNLVVDSLLGELNDARLYSQGYADDICILLEGFCLRTVSELMQRALSIVERWCEETGLTVNPLKTELVLFTTKRIRTGLVLPHLCGVELALSEEVKFLGVTLDQKLSWKSHVQAKCRKAIMCLWQCRRIACSRWGATPKVMRWIYTAVVRPMLCYAAAVWWPRVCLGVSRMMLNHVQRVACLGIAGAMRTTPTAALEVLLDLPPLDIYVKMEAMASAVRLRGTGRWRRLADAGHTLIWDQAAAEIPVVMVPKDRVDKKFIFKKNFEVVVPSRERWNNVTCIDTPPNTVNCFTDGSLLKGKAGAGVHIETEGETFSANFPLGTYVSVFQSEVYALLACARELHHRGIVGQDITIYTDSQAALKALEGPSFKSALVIECHEAITQMGQNNNVRLSWVPGHMGIQGNEFADQLARTGSSMSFTGPEPAVGVSSTLQRTAIRNWARKKHGDRWRNLQDCRQARELMGGPNTRFTKQLVTLPRRQVSILVSVLTGHNTLNRHLTIMGIQNNAGCEACDEGLETSLHFLGDCPAWGAKRMRYLGAPRLEANDIKTLDVASLVAFIKATRRLDMKQ